MVYSAKIQPDLSFDLCWPWASSSLLPSFSTEPLSCSLEPSGCVKLHFLKGHTGVQDMKTDFNRPAEHRCRWLMSVFSQTLQKPAAPLHNLGQGVIPPYSSKRRTAPADLRKKGFKISLVCVSSCSSPSFYGISAFMLFHFSWDCRYTKSFSESSFLLFQVTFAYITVPGCKQSPSERQLQTVAEHKKPLILIFPPLWMNLLKNRIHSPRQENISGVLWACQGCTERCVSNTIFVPPLPMVEAGQRNPDRWPWTPCSWSAAYIVGFLRSICDR